MFILGLIGAINCITSIALGLVVFLRNPRGTLNRIYGIINVAVALYSFGYSAWQFSGNLVSATRWFNVLFCGTILINLLYLFLVFAFTEQLASKRVFLSAYSLVNIIFLWMQETGCFYERLEPRYGMGFWPVPTFWLHVYFVFWQLSCFYGCWELLRGFHRTSGLKRQQIKIVTIACTVGYLGGATNWPMWYRIPIPPYATIGISLHVALIGYAVFRHRLMDFNLLFRWGLAYGILLLLVAGSVMGLYSGFVTLGLSKRVAFLGIASAMVFIFEPLRNRITRLVDRSLFKSPDFQSILHGVNVTIEGPNSLISITSQLSRELKAIWNASHAGLVVWDRRQSAYSLFPPEEFKHEIISRMDVTIQKTDFLVKTLETERRLFKFGIVTEDEVTAFGSRSGPGERTTFWKIRRTMRWLGAAVCVPLMADDLLLGFIVLGPKSSGIRYDSEDKKFLAHLAELIAAPISKLIIGSHDNAAQGTISAEAV